jgi:mannose-1-phosphate guanylyltransferase/phosphomannomutase
MRKLSSDVDQKKIDLVDGIRINEGNAWVLVLPGASHPLLHLYGEGETAELRDAIMEEYSAKIREHLAVI